MSDCTCYRTGVVMGDTIGIDPECPVHAHTYERRGAPVTPPHGSLPAAILQARDALERCRAYVSPIAGVGPTVRSSSVLVDLCSNALNALDALIEQAVVEYRCPQHGTRHTLPLAEDRVEWGCGYHVGRNSQGFLVACVSELLPYVVLPPEQSDV